MHGDSKKQIQPQVGIEPRTPDILVKHSPIWAKLSSASLVIFNLTFVSAPIDFWT